MRDGYDFIQSFSDTPLLLNPQSVSSVRALIEGGQQPHGLAHLARNFGRMFGLGGEDRERVEVDAMMRSCRSLGITTTDPTKPYIFADGVAVIPVVGVLLHRDAYSGYGATGYDFIRSRFKAAVGDPDVKLIVFDVDSGGGHAMGNFELCREIYDSRSVKPSLAIVDGSAYSGGYSIASSASRLVLLPSGGVGSIGVVTMHISVEKMLDNLGVDITLIHAGAHKVDGNMFEALPDGVRKRTQADLNKTYDTFVNTVARNRGLDASKVRDTEALCFRADEALALGLIDAIQTPSEALDTYLKELSGSSTDNTNVSKGDNEMSDNTPNTTAPVAPNVEAPAPAAPKVEAPKVEAPKVDAAAAERARIQGITTCEEAKGRESLAQHFAYNTDMSVDAAKAALTAAPVAAAAKGNAFERAMDNTENPNVGTGYTGDTGDGKEMSRGERMAKNYEAITGNKLRKD